MLSLFLLLGKYFTSNVSHSEQSRNGPAILGMKANKLFVTLEIKMTKRPSPPPPPPTYLLNEESEEDTEVIKFFYCSFVITYYAIVVP